MLPSGTETTRRYLDYFFADGVDAGWIEEMIAFDSEVGAEDTVLVERVQRGVRSGAIEHGRLLPESERLVAHFQRLLLAELAT